MGSEVVWAPVVAALGSSFLTGLVAFGLDARKARRQQRESLLELRRRSYSRLLVAAGLMGHTADALHVAMEVRSGVSEGANVTRRSREPVDPLELYERLRQDLQPLYDAWSDVWTVGTSEAIPLANHLVDKCGSVVGAATTRGAARSLLGRLLAGEKWTEEQLRAWAVERQALAEARKSLAELARRESGIEVAELFSEDPTDTGADGR
jgi:hypothetical protein